MMRKPTMKLILFLTVVLCVFSVAGCDRPTENDAVQDARIAVYQVTYEYEYAQVEIWDTESGAWHDYSLDTLSEADYSQLMRYDGDHAVCLKAKDLFATVGERITVNSDNAVFSGTLEAMPARLSIFAGDVEMELIPTPEQIDKVLFGFGMVDFNSYVPRNEYPRHKYVYFSIWFSDVEIGEDLYRYEVRYQADLGPISENT